MKSILFLSVAAFIFIGCESHKQTVNKTANSVQAEKEVSRQPGNLTASTNSVSTTAANRSGEKIEQPTEISFPPEGFPEGWRWIDPEYKYNPTKYDVQSGVLRLEVPTDKDFYGETRTAPRLLKTIAGDFELETRVNFDPKEEYQGAGLLVFRNDSNYLRLERGYGGVGGGANGIRFDTREDEVYEPLATQENFPTAAKTVDLKLRRAGREFTAYWREPDGAWREVGKYPSSYPETVQVGLIVCNTAEKIAVEFERIKLSPVK